MSNITIKEEVVYRDGEPVGAIEGDTCFLTVKLASPIKGAVRKAANMPDLKFDDPKPDTPTAAKLTDEELLAMLQQRGLAPKSAPPAPVPGPQPVNSFTEVNVGVHVDPLQRIRDLAVAGKIPPQPRARPALGDKDPQVVEWARAYATPEEFAQKYRGKLPSYRDHEEGEKRWLTRKLPNEKEDKGND